jgi:hypothetical protein
MLAEKVSARTVYTARYYAGSMNAGSPKPAQFT